MHIRRLRTLALTTALLSGVVVGGLAAGTAAAAPAPAHPKIATVKGHPSIEYARERGQERAKLRAAERHTNAVQGAPDCASSYPNSSGSVVAQRFGGLDRYAVAVCVSQYAWYNSTDTEPDHQGWVADAVVLARGDAYADALAGGPLAGQVEGPLLLTKSTSLPSNVRAELQRVLAPHGKVYLLGGTGSISDGVKNTITSLGYNPVRIGGADRFQVAINIAKAMPVTSTFYITNGLNFADALAAGNAAAAYTIDAKYDPDPDSGKTPVVLLFSNGTTMPKVSTDFANQRGEALGYWGLWTAGGAGDTAAVKAFGEDNIGIHYVGATRYSTATMINEDVFNDGTGKVVSPFIGLADGLNYPDALTASPLLAGTASPLLLTPPTKLDPATATYLRNHAGDFAGADDPTMFVWTFGGPASVSDSTMIAARTALTPTA